MGFLIIVHSIAVNWDEVTRGARGLSQIPTSTNPWVAYIWAAIAVYVALRLRNSPYGRAMIASRENLIASRSIGVNVLRSRLLAFVVSAFLTGVAGSLLAHQIGTVAPSGFYFATTFTVIIMVVLGGMGSISGAVVGAIIMTIMPELMRPTRRRRPTRSARVRSALRHLQYHPGRRLHSGHDLPTARTLRRARARVGAPRAAHAATGMGRRGHRRNTGDGTRGRRTDPRSSGLSGDPLPPTIPRRAFRRNARYLARRNFTFSRAAWYDAQRSTLQIVADRLLAGCRWLGVRPRQRGVAEWS